VLATEVTKGGQRSSVIWWQEAQRSPAVNIKCFIECRPRGPQEQQLQTVPLPAWDIFPVYLAEEFVDTSLAHHKASEGYPSSRAENDSFRSRLRIVCMMKQWDTSRGMNIATSLKQAFTRGYPASTTRAAMGYQQRDEYCGIPEPSLHQRIPSIHN
jgi:hypothetical protein